MKQVRAMMLWLFIIFIAFPLVMSLCIYYRNSDFWVSLGIGFIRFYVFLIVGVFLVRIIAKITNRGDKNE